MNTTIHGVSVPVLGFGTWPLTGAAAVAAVTDALAVGYRHLDTARMYRNEREVGRALRQSGVNRSEVFLTTKIWHTDAEPARVHRSAEAGLRELDTDYVDLLLLHWPSDHVTPEQTLEAMFELQYREKVRHVGVSNFPPRLLERATHVGPIFCNQVEYHPFLSQQPLLDLCGRKDVLLTAYSPLATGKVHGDATLREIGEAHGKSPAQVTLRWLIQQPGVAAIPKASTPEHRRGNFDVFDFELTEAEMGRIFALDRGERLINPGFAPQWES
ncbi:MAG: aldo/keto reductase [Ferruginibacter sp.]|nr:aldo/keto reductase [Cytophagales bacterium]